MNNKQKHKINYRDSGVNIEKADALINSIKSKHKKKDKNVISGIGGFSSLYRIDKKIKNPVIVSGTDGVGTKLKIANRLNIHKYIGQDLVAMCVNDVITCGAQPLFFLDYLATSKIDLNVHKDVLKSIKKACEDSEMTLIGGETAEMPGMYNTKEYDLAGFCVGVVEKSEIIDGLAVCNGDSIIGIKSSGPHSNGFSLIRKIIERTKKDPRDLSINGTNILESVMSPTKIYVDSILKLLEQKLYENIKMIKIW